MGFTLTKIAVTFIVGYDLALLHSKHRVVNSVLPVRAWFDSAHHDGNTFASLLAMTALNMALH